MYVYLFLYLVLVDFHVSVTPFFFLFLKTWRSNLLLTIIIYFSLSIHIYLNNRFDLYVLLKDWSVPRNNVKVAHKQDGNIFTVFSIRFFRFLKA